MEANDESLGGHNSIDGKHWQCFINWEKAYNGDLDKKRVKVIPILKVDDDMVF